MQPQQLDQLINRAQWHADLVAAAVVVDVHTSCILSLRHLGFLGWDPLMGVHHVNRQPRNGAARSACALHGSLAAAAAALLAAACWLEPPPYARSGIGLGIVEGAVSNIKLLHVLHLAKFASWKLMKAMRMGAVSSLKVLEWWRHAGWRRHCTSKVGTGFHIV